MRDLVAFPLVATHSTELVHWRVELFHHCVIMYVYCKIRVCYVPMLVWFTWPLKYLWCHWKSSSVNPLRLKNPAVFCKSIPEFSSPPFILTQQSVSEKIYIFKLLTNACAFLSVSLMQHMLMHITMCPSLLRCESTVVKVKEKESPARTTDYVGMRQ